MKTIRSACLIAAAFYCAALPASAGSKLGPDAPPLQLAQKGKGGGTPPGQGGDPPGGGGPPGGDPPGQGGTPPGQGGTPPGQGGGDQPPAATPSTEHESGVHGTTGRDSGAFGQPSGLRGLEEVPQGR